ncbi:uncharacterized protein LOC132901751 [Amyelois transitella]|uniref:uncharacterized protein LOC132901751 n=1 Tax=Amyelois transitella TaxID=680683 RepID=UPI00067D25C3|nr:uncharacterized protein LOC132901751 [Amyelois transitella]
MTKFAVFVVLAAFICASSVHVFAQEFNNAFPDSEKQWTPDFPTMKPLDAQDIINLRPDDNNTKVEGESHKSSSSMKVVNGKVVEDTAETQDIVNKNGNVTETETSN